MTEQELANVIWDIKEIIRNLYDDAEVEDVILPFTLLRRLDCVLDGKRDAIMNEIKDLPDAQKKFKLKALMRQNGLSFFNTSGLSLEKLLGAPNQIGQSFATYLEGFTDNVKDILANFVHTDTDSDEIDLSPLYSRLERSNKLFSVIQLFVQRADLHPDVVSNAMMGTVFEIDLSGNDLYVEYSLLWNETLVDNLVTTNQYLDTRIGDYFGGSSNAISYVSLTNNNTHADCVYAGGFEYTSLKENEDGTPYPRMIGKYADKTAYPNIGGSNGGDGVSQGDTQWGWHRIGMKLHETVKNEEAVRGGATATYRITCELYIDGVLVSILGRDCGDGKWLASNLLFTAEYDGQGGITYSDMAATKWLTILYVNNPKTKTGEKAYFIYKDVFATCGQGFVQNVSKVASPANATFTLPDSTVIPAKVYYSVN